MKEHSLALIINEVLQAKITQPEWTSLGTLMTNRSRRRYKSCAYCGEVRPATRDHVIPKCLFERPLPQNMLTVPACDECNGRKSLHDDFLRDLLTSDVAGSESPVAQRIFNDKVVRSSQKGKSLFAKVADRSMLQVPIEIDGRHEWVNFGTFGDDRAAEMFSFLIRGLFHVVTKSILPVECEIRVRRLFHDGVEEMVSFFNDYSARQVIDVGPGVFSCAHNWSESNTAASVWFLEFYGRVHFGAVTKPAEWP